RAVSAAMDGRSNRDPPSRQDGARTVSHQNQPPNTHRALNKNPNSQATIQKRPAKGRGPTQTRRPNPNAPPSVTKQIEHHTPLD
ncbi:MAG TPA: hypothetical protein VGC74_02575, partial [Stenotrophomonas sp.]